jgi:predicted nucleic acid-binding protein
MIVLDTNVVSEALHPDPSSRVAQWVSARDKKELFITAVTAAELLYGVEILPAGKRRMRLQNAIEEIISLDFNGRVLPFDEKSARIYAKISGARQKMGRRISQSDAMIASISLSNNAALATRNTKDLDDCGLPLINPWDA